MPEILALFLMPALVWATGSQVCVRNYIASYNVCEHYPKDYTYLVSVDPELTTEICARLRPASFCGMHKDFVEVVSRSKQKVCVENFDTDIINLCETNPKQFVYIWKDGQP